MESLIHDLPLAPEWARAAGDGYGYGYGDGYGDGYGYGYGYGDGDGDGYGDGYGYGYGDGDGDGYGDGYGATSKAYWLSTIDLFATRWPEAQRQRLAELRACGATVAFWRSDERGGAANGGSCEPVQPGLIQEEPGPLRDRCGEGQLHATGLPHKWKGERWWVVALLGEVKHNDDKSWSLKREIVGECL